MPRYRYTAVDSTGKTVRGYKNAGNEQELFENLKQEGIYLLTAKEDIKQVPQKALSSVQLAVFCKELGIMLGSGVSLMQALSIISQKEGLRAGERAVYVEVLRSVGRGMPLSEALEAQGKSFPILMIYMFRASETAGTMAQTALELSGNFTQEYRLSSKIKNATAYPKLLCMVFLAAVCLLAGVILPQFRFLFSLIDELPLSTRILYAVIDQISGHWKSMVLLAGLLMAAVKALASWLLIRQAMDWLRMHIPFIGKFFMVIYTARFARTLSSLYAVGIPLVVGIEIAGRTTGSVWVEKQIGVVVSKLYAGESLSEALESVDGFVKMLSFSVRVGEESGNLGMMLETVAKTLEYDSGQAVERLLFYLEPVLIIVLAVLVGFVMIAVMLPIYDSYIAIGISL